MLSGAFEKNGRIGMDEKNSKLIVQGKQLSGFILLETLVSSRLQSPLSRLYSDRLKGIAEEKCVNVV